MIVLDTSALIAILNNEAQADACATAIEGADALAISAGTVAEAVIVAAARGMTDRMLLLLDGLDLEVANVTAPVARRVGEIYQRWGKGFHPAGLNFGDCFAYELARSRDCALLFVGHDFAQTDIRSAL